MDELNPCPFCGEKKDIVLDTTNYGNGYDAGDEWTAEIKCLKCSATLFSDNYFPTERKAMNNVKKKWNRRAKDEP